MLTGDKTDGISNIGIFLWPPMKQTEDSTPGEVSASAAVMSTAGAAV